MCKNCESIAQLVNEMRVLLATIWFWKIMRDLLKIVILVNLRTQEYWALVKFLQYHACVFWVGKVGVDNGCS